MDTSRQFDSDSLEAHIEDSRRIRVRQDIARRLDRICSHLAEHDFRELVDAMTERQIKSERRAIRDL